MSYKPDPVRRQILVTLGAVTGSLLAPAPLLSAAGRLEATPPQTAGPFYPDDLPLDRDNDLVRIKDGPKAKGTISNVFGRVLYLSGEPVQEARVEIWQCDANGRYHHQDDPNDAAMDPNFQGFGATTTDADGRYRFRTIKPVPYPQRTPHIHFRIKGREFDTLTTQMYVKGHPLNADDGIFRRIASPELVQAKFVGSSSNTAEMEAKWDIVLGATEAS